MPGLHTQHPDSEKLADFGLGRLSEADSTVIEQHLADCAECRKKLEVVPADSLVCLLQASVSKTQAGLNLSSPSTDTDSSSPSEASLPPLYKKLAQIIAGKPGYQSERASSPKDGSGDTAAASAGFTVPRELEGHGRYLVLEPLGAGGMGTVYKAQHRLMERVVAIKIVNRLLVTKPGAVERFTREVKAAAQLVHPNIVTAYDAERVGDMHLLVMEYVAGRTLAHALTEERELSVAKACDYLRQTALGLQHALERGMAHRDIKPQNLMLTSKGEIKILDFGLARFVSEQARSDGSTEHGSLMGSPDYMAPEQAHDAHAADTRADIYGMGCTLYHLLAGQVPFPEASLLAKLEAHRDKQPIPLNHLRTDVPAELARVVEKMLAKDPVQRYQTPGEVAKALRPFTQRQPALLAANPSTWQPALARTYRKPMFALAVAACLLFGLGYWLTQIVFRVETPGGTLIIRSDDPDVQISVKSAGNEVVLFFPKEKKEIPLRVGEYSIELVKGKDGLKLSTKTFRIESGQGKTVTVEFVPVVAATRTPRNEESPKKTGEPTQAPAEVAFPFTPEEGRKKQEQCAQHLRREVFETNSAGMKLALIPPGEFPMTPEYRVRLTKPYYLGVHEVTVGQFRQFVNETGHKTECEGYGGGSVETPGKQKPEYIWSNRVFSPTDDHPVVFVSWNDAKKYCAWLSLKEKKLYRLPTEAEWEWASRAGAVADTKAKQSLGWFQMNSGKKSQPVGRLSPNSLGLFDMFGNVAELCQDFWYGDFKLPVPIGSVIDPTGPVDPKDPAGEQRRVVRGGSFFHPPAVDLGCFNPRLAMHDAGFRVVCNVAPFEAKGQKKQEEWAEQLNRRVFETNSAGMKLALIPPGEFTMWGDYRVRLTKPFYLGVHEVTVGQFRQFVKETAYQTDAEAQGGGRIEIPPAQPKPEYIWSNRDFSPTDQHPVVFVTWNDANKFCAWLSRKENKHYRMPTEAEWDWASRAGAFADDKTKVSLGWFQVNSGNKSQPVGKLPANALGLFDMFGNVLEICQDFYGKNPNGTFIDPKGPTEGITRILRGGSFNGTVRQIGNFSANLTMVHAGFRVVCDVAPPDVCPADPSLPTIPSVNELLKTREVLTVAQDGSGSFKTIGEAQLLLGMEGRAEVDVGVDAGPVEFDGFLAAGDGVCQLVLTFQGVAQVAPCRCVVRPQRHGSSIAACRLFRTRTPLEAEGSAQLVMNPEIGRMLTLGEQQHPDRLIHLTRPPEVDCQVRERGRGSAVQVRSRGERQHGLDVLVPHGLPKVLPPGILVQQSDDFQELLGPGLVPRAATAGDPVVQKRR